MQNKNDILLVRRLIKNDRGSFNQLFMCYNKKIYVLARKFNLCHEDAEEIVQEVFMTIWNRRSQLNPELSISAYIYKISKNAILKAFHKKARKKAADDYNIKYFIHQDQLLSSLEIDELNNTLHKCINKLPAQRKKIFIMSRDQELSHQEIANQLNISIRTVESQIYKALKFLKEQLQKEEIFLTLLLAYLI